MPPNDDGIFLPIQGGKALTDTDLHIQGDNELNGQPCDNISDKNPTYSELTAMYWAWKNLKKLHPEVKYIGLCHYRRFFAFDERKFFTPDIPASEDTISHYKLDTDKIIRTLESGKIILVKPDTFPYSVKAHYCICHISDNYRATQEVIHEKFPDYYDAFLDVMEHSNKLSARNMFIMKWEDFERYCEWLFAVLSEIDNRVHYQDYGTYQKRVPAFIAERLFNVYVRKNAIRAKYFNIYSSEHSPVKTGMLRNFLSYIKRCLTVLRCNTAMFILNIGFWPLRKLLKKSPLKP